MGDRQPLVAELGRQVDAVAKLLAQVPHVDLRQLVGGAAGEDRRVRVDLEEHEVGLPQHGRVDVVHGGGQQLAAGEGIGLLAQQPVGDQHLGEDRGGLGERQRGVLGEAGAVARQHAVDGVAELVGQGRHVAHPAGEVDQHPRCVAGEHGVAEGAAALALADLAVEVALGKDPLSVFRKLGVEIVERLQHRADGVGVVDLAVGAGERGVEVVAPELREAQPTGLQPEVALEEADVLARGLQQHLDGAVGDVVVQVAHGEGGGVAAQHHLLVVPVARHVGVDLAEDVRLAGVDPVELPVGGLALVRLGGEGVAHQLVAGELPLLAIHRQLELQTVGEHRIEGEDGFGARLVLDVDDLLGLLVERMGLEAPQVLEVLAVVAVLALGRQQAPGLLVGEVAPPEGEEEIAVVRLRHRLPHAVAEGQRLLAAGVRVEPERGVAVDHLDQVLELLVLAEDGEEGVRLHLGIEVRAPLLEVRHRRFEAGEPGGELLLAGFRQQLREVPASQGVGGEGPGDYVHGVLMSVVSRSRVAILAEPAARRPPPPLCPARAG